MSRLSSPEQIAIRPTNNVYTALVVVCVVLQIIGLIALYMVHSDLFPKDGLFT